MKRLILTFLIFHIAMSLPAANFWQRVETPGTGFVTDIVKSADGTYYTYAGGIFKSNDLVNWTSYFKVFNNDTCTIDFRVFPWVKSKILYIDNAGLFSYNSHEGIAKLEANGDRLLQIYPDSIDNYLYSESIIMDSSGRCWGQGTYGVHYSLDTMKTWIMDTLFPDIKYGLSGIGISPDNELFVFHRSKIYRRHIDSTNYVKCIGDDIGEVKCIYFGEEKYYAGSYTNCLIVSTDKGRHWEYVSSPPYHDQINTVIETKNKTLFIGTQRYGLYSSKNGGLAWEIQKEFWYSTIYNIKYIDDRLWVCTSKGLYYSDNDGEQWTKLEPGSGLTTGTMQTITKSGKYLLTSGNKVYSTDKIGNELTEFKINANFIPAWMHSGPKALWAVEPNDYFLYRSKDEGQSWQQVNLGNKDTRFRFTLECDNHISFDSLGRVVIYGDFDNDFENIYCTSDGGDSWNFLIDDFKNWSSPESRLIRSDGSSFLYFSQDSLTYSSDYGKTWKSVPNLPIVGNNVVCDGAIYKNHIFIATCYNGFYQYNIDTKEWKCINDGLERIKYYDVPSFWKCVNDISRIDTMIYIATFMGPFKKSINDTTWTDISDGNIFGMTTSLKWLPDGHLYVSSHTGLWRSTEKFISVEDQPALPPAIPELTIYPNPAKSTARLSLPGAPIDRVDIYDLEGRQAGNTGVQYDGGSPVINVEGLPAGVYIVQVSSGKRMFSARLVVAHG